jgi:hypothetical protein
MSEFDTEQFIVEVQRRPALWDSSTDDYSNRVIRKKSWNELCELFIPNFNSKTGPEKSAVGMLSYYLCVFKTSLKTSKSYDTATGLVLRAIQNSQQKRYEL